MTYGIDTGFLVAAEILEHNDHLSARNLLARLMAAGHRLAIAPQVLAEFMHIVTDPRRFEQAHDMPTARRIANRWWTAREVEQIYPNEEAVRLFLGWMHQHRLGRKRLLDTLLAATYRSVGISSLLTTNPGDFGVLGGFTCLIPHAEIQGN